MGRGSGVRAQPELLGAEALRERSRVGVGRGGGERKGGVVAPPD